MHPFLESDSGAYDRSKIMTIALICVFVVTVIIIILYLDINNSSTRKIDILKVGVIPDRSEASIIATYTPLLEHIKSETGIDYELIIPPTYEGLLEMFRDKEVDMALFGAITYAHANIKYGAIPLALRDIDLKFSSVVLVTTDNPAKNIFDLKGSKFAFGTKLSTSGHLMPRYFLEEREIFAETFFDTVLYTGAHDKTAKLIRDGVVDAGVLNTKIADAMYQDGRIDTGEVKVIWESPTYANYVWAVQPYVKELLQQQLVKAFLSLQSENDRHLKILAANSAKYYLPARNEFFKTAREIVIKLESLESEHE